MALPKSPITETMSVSESRKQYSEILNRVFKDDERVVIEKNGIPVAAIVPMSVANLAEEKERRRAELLQSWHEVQKAFVGVSEEEADREIAEALDEIKQERLLARRIVSAISHSEPDLITQSQEHLESAVTQFLRDEASRSELAKLRGNGK